MHNGRGGRKITAVDVFLQRRKAREEVGRLTRNNDGYMFEYKDSYAYGERSIPIGPDLDLSKKRHYSKKLFPSFEDRIPSKKNPAYQEYCRAVGIDPGEKDPLVLASTLGRKGPSSFVFVPAYSESFSRFDLIKFRRELNLSIREFADAFDFAPATINRIENAKTSGKDALKRIEIYSNFPQVALFELERSGYKISDLKRVYVEKVLKSKLS